MRLEVLVLTHEAEQVKCVMPYMSAACAPMPVINFWGRSARKAPECKPHDSIWHWFMDRLLAAI